MWKSCGVAIQVLPTWTHSLESRLDRTKEKHPALHGAMQASLKDANSVSLLCRVSFQTHALSLCCRGPGCEKQHYKSLSGFFPCGWGVFLP